MKLFHLTSSVLLILAHSFFFFRGLYFIRHRGNLTAADKLARFFAQLCIPLVIFSGLLITHDWNPEVLLHILPALLMILLFPLNFLLRTFIFKTKKWPWLLPLLNLLLMLMAFVWGLGGLH